MWRVHGKVVCCGTAAKTCRTSPSASSTSRWMTAACTSVWCTANFPSTHILLPMRKLSRLSWWCERKVRRSTHWFVVLWVQGPCIRPLCHWPSDDDNCLVFVPKNVLCQILMSLYTFRHLDITWLHLILLCLCVCPNNSVFVLFLLLLTSYCLLEGSCFQGMSFI